MIKLITEAIKLKSILEIDYEGGIRIPFIVQWPSRIVKKSRSNHLGAFWDLLPTLTEAAGKPVQSQDGISFLPTILRQPQQLRHEYLYWEFHEFGGRQAVRKGKWKYIIYNVMNKDKRTMALFDLEKDSGEQKNVAEQYPQIVKELQNVMDQSRVPSPQFPFIESLK